jgi:hypothetical protein
VDKLLKSMSMKQFQEWRFFDEIDPIGGRRGDWQAASISAVIANMLSRKAHNVDDFLLTFGTERRMKPAPRKQTWQEQKMLAYMMCAAFNEPPKKGKKRGR